MTLTPFSCSLATVAFEVSKPSTSSTQAGTFVSTLPWSCHCQAAVVGPGAQRPPWVASTLLQTESTAAAAGPATLRLQREGRRGRRAPPPPGALYARSSTTTGISRSVFSW